MLRFFMLVFCSLPETTVESSSWSVKSLSKVFCGTSQHFQGGREQPSLLSSPMLSQTALKTFHHSTTMVSILLKKFVLIMEITLFSFQIVAGSCTSLKVKLGHGVVGLGLRDWARFGFIPKAPPPSLRGWRGKKLGTQVPGKA